MNIFILEDWPDRITKFNDMFYGHRIVQTKDVGSAINALYREKFDVIFLDYDLGGDVTGYVVAKEINKTMNYETPVVIHSYNPVGTSNMFALLEGERSYYMGRSLVHKRIFGTFDNCILELFKDEETNGVR